LQHACTLAHADPSATLWASQAADDLGFDARRVDRLLDLLGQAQLIARHPAGERFTITPRGVVYVQRREQRRRSVRRSGEEDAQQAPPLTELLDGLRKDPLP